MKAFKKMIVMLTLLALSSPLFSQNETNAVVYPEKMNVLYVGIDNPISVSVPGVPNDKLLVSIDHGTITGSNGKYIVKVSGNDKTSVISVAAEITKGEIKNYGSYAFRIKGIPKPTTSIGTYQSTAICISKAELLKNPYINVSSDLPFEFNFTILSYSFTYKGSDKVLNINGNKFTQEVIDSINNMKDGDVIIIDKIKAKTSNGTEVMLEPILIQITEKL